MMEEVGIALLISVVAALYASVGLAGATGYLALMALLGFEAGAMKAASLLLNALVALVGTLVFAGPGGDSLRLARLSRPIIAAAVPMAFLGGAIRLPPGVYLPIIGVILVGSAIRLLCPPRHGGEGTPARAISAGAAAALGAAIGLGSGLTGTGGGIFLLPALQLLGWAGPREAAAVVAPFVMVTSMAGLAGHLARSPALPPALALWAPAAVVGGIVGARLGRDRLDPRTLRRILAALLAVAGVKLLAQ